MDLTTLTTKELYKLYWAVGEEQFRRGWWIIVILVVSAIGIFFVLNRKDRNK